MNELLMWVLTHEQEVRQAGVIAFAAGLAGALIGGLRIAYARVWDVDPPSEVDDEDMAFWDLVDGWAERHGGDEVSA